MRTLLWIGLIALFAAVALIGCGGEEAGGASGEPAEPLGMDDPEYQSNSTDVPGVKLPEGGATTKAEVEADMEAGGSAPLSGDVDGLPGVKAPGE
ncbi:MAG: hypothetical protein GF320_12185 [Armatimonadia bacterium]|nr:hypothetical protein [Armatimonadia bacterium]